MAWRIAGSGAARATMRRAGGVTQAVLVALILVVASRAQGRAEESNTLIRADGLREPPPIAVWSSSLEVDEPESAFLSIGRTLWHAGHNATQIAGFHDWLRKNSVDPLSLLPGDTTPPVNLHGLLLDPERYSNAGWKVNGDWIVSGPGHRGPEARFPLKIESRGFYRAWIRYFANPCSGRAMLSGGT